MLLEGRQRGAFDLGAFDFVILLFSFIYTLGLTHLLFAATRMIRHRRSLTFSWAHALWMLDALLLLMGNWISLWDFHRMEALPIAVIGAGLVLSVTQYFLSALVAPDFDEGETYDMKAFHARERPTYLAAFLALLILALAANFAAGAGAGVENWARQNALVLAMFPPVLVPMFVRTGWVQVLCPAILTAELVGFLALYYPVLAR